MVMLLLGTAAANLSKRRARKMTRTFGAVNFGECKPEELLVAVVRAREIAKGNKPVTAATDQLARSLGSSLMKAGQGA